MIDIEKTHPICKFASRTDDPLFNSAGKGCTRVDVIIIKAAAAEANIM
jgi:hypothetical protein